MKAEELHGKSIVSMADGERLGIVEDIFIDPAMRKITMVTLNGLKGRAAADFADFQTIGPDAITVLDRSAMHQNSSMYATEPLLTLHQLHGLDAVTGAGETLGKVHFIEFDPQSGAITEIEATAPGFAGFGHKVLHIPADAIVSLDDAVRTNLDALPAADAPSEPLPRYYHSHDTLAKANGDSIYHAAHE